MILSGGSSSTAMFYFATVVLVAGFFLDALALGQPLERPKSLTMKMLEDVVAIAGQSA